MPTSGTFAFATTARDLIQKALREIKVLPAGEDATSEELDDAILSLNGMLKSWQTEDSVWREESVTVPISAGDAATTLDSDIRDVVDARLAVSATYERPMQVWTRADYNQVPNKLVGGDPLTFYFSRQRGDAILYVWPVPTTDVNVILECIRGIETITNASQNIDVPEDWAEAVWTNLAVRLAGSYGAAAELTPELVNRADALYQRLLDSSRPASYFMGPWDDRCYG